MTAILKISEKDSAKLCAKCQHLRGRRIDIWDSAKWQCFKFPIGIDVVNGNFVYENCVDTRTNITKCGLNGALYEEYMPPIRTEEPTIGGKEATELATEVVFDSEQLRKNREAAAAAIAAKRAAKGLL